MKFSLLMTYRVPTHSLPICFESFGRKMMMMMMNVEENAILIFFAQRAFYRVNNLLKNLIAPYSRPSQ
jgi:hypothetical protein